MVIPASSFSIVTEAVVSKLSGVIFAAPNWPESAIVKQPACAAAINSSGFVPLPFSKRVEKEYCAFERVPICNICGAQLAGKRHREAARVRRGDQLFRIRALAILKTSGKRILRV